MKEFEAIKIEIIIFNNHEGVLTLSNFSNEGKWDFFNDYEEEKM